MIKKKYCWKHIPLSVLENDPIHSSRTSPLIMKNEIQNKNDKCRRNIGRFQKIKPCFLIDMFVPIDEIGV